REHAHSDEQTRTDANAHFTWTCMHPARTAERTGGLRSRRGMTAAARSERWSARGCHLYASRARARRRGRVRAVRGGARRRSERPPMKREFENLDTKLIHAGEPDPRVAGAVVMPVFQSAMFEYAGESDYHALRYIRLNNTPNHEVLHAKLAALENAEAALVTSSGMAAISTTLLTLLGPGDHLLAQSCLYGGTHDLVTKDFPGFGIEHDFVAGSDPDTWESKLRPTTKAFYLESMSNPLLEVPDIEAA